MSHNRVLIFLLYASLSVFALVACDSKETNSSTAGLDDSSLTPEQREWKAFVANYRVIKDFPVNFPAADSEGDTILIKPELLKKYLFPADSILINKDYPALSENAEAMNYLYIGRLQTDSFIALVTEKHQQGEKEDYSAFFYLTTFSNSGQLLNHVCLALDETLGSNRTLMTGLVNKDMSLHLRTEEYDGEKVVQSSNSKFYEVTSKGQILVIGQPAGGATL